MTNNIPFFSIIMPTYNSEATIEYTFQSIDNQTLNKSELEVIVVDGGSTDNTVEIAERYGASVFYNEKRLPEYAKVIGSRAARGRYIIRMDSDEEFSYSEQLQEKKDFLISHPEIKVLLPNRCVAGRKSICGVSAAYLNTLGDPFSYFVYKTKIDKYETYKKHIVQTDGKYAIMKFDNDDVYPLADSGASCYSLEYMRAHYPDKYDTIEYVCGTYDIIISDTKMCGCIKGDNIKHNCSSSLKVYFSKLRFRVINNLFYKEESGFSSKEKFSKDLSYRKKLFCIYAAIVPLPILDSIRLAIVYKNVSFLLHFVYLYYICFEIMYCLLLSLLGVKVENNNYGK